MTRTKLLLRRWFAAQVDDEYRRVTTDNVILRNQNRCYETALAGATVDLQEQKADILRAVRREANLESELVELQGVHRRVVAQRDNLIGQLDAAFARLRELGEYDLEVPGDA